MSANPYQMYVPGTKPPTGFEPEYNPQGDAANGMTGSMTPGSVGNASTQRAGGTSGRNAFEAMLNHSAALKSFSRPPAPASTPTRTPPFDPRMQTRSVPLDQALGLAPQAPNYMSYSASSFGDGIENRDPNDRGGNGGDTRGGTGGPPITPPPAPTPPPNPSRWDTRQTTGPVPTEPGTGDIDPVTGRRRIAGGPVPHPNPGIDPNAWATILRWSQDPDFKGYERLLTDRAWSFPEYTEDAARQEAAGNIVAGKDKYDFVDWYAHRFGDSTGDLKGESPQFMRNGYDTFLYYKDPDTGQLIPRSQLRGSGYGTPVPPPQGTPEPPPPDPATVPPPAGGTPPPTETAPPPVTPPVPPTPPVDAPPTPAPPPVIADDTPFGPPTSEATPPGTATPTDLAGSIDRLMKGVNPLYAQQQDALARQLRHQAGVSGMNNSGGFGETFGKSMGDLINTQGADLSNKIFGAEQSALDRGLQKYIADQGTRTALKTLETNAGMQRYLSDVNAAVAREGIKTNADLERSKLDFSRYGVDKNDVLERYKAELALAGIKYSSQMQLDASKYASAAGRAGASASAAAAKYEADLKRELGILGYDVAREGNLQQFMLGLAQLGPEWARIIFGSSSDSFLNGGNTIPGNVVVRP